MTINVTTQTPALPTIQHLDHPGPDLRSRIVAPLAEFSTKKDFAFAPQFVTLGLQTEDGIDGGLACQLYWDWMHIEILAVPERWRGLGLGRALVERAEAIAREAGCTGVWVDTYSFQSPGFYAAMGYAPFGRLPNYPKGETRIFFAKLFDEDFLSPPEKAA
ncbi:GNAT family N-acetyltransferase [Jiella mangrovi]|uniref:GNAT family N-acetyltransferase n=1 Tax=Jiella mangrovi TaxID=2821407 RepID=A0ABS4BLA9_9HYPH|nr:GNAT family N-acetyltransferase [Jiella mangrovi]MBP0617302.1 GNAT family N-acetyltransferase [Jiella mangrovi]